MNKLLIASATGFALLAGAVSAAQTSVAVASNFTEPAREIAAAFEAATGHTAVLSFGSTGQLYAQITQGAPFEVFLAADDEHPERAIAEGLAVEDTAFTYARGQLALWTRVPGMTAGDDLLKAGNFTKLAIANPETAPYGQAAMEALEALGLLEELTPKFVQGNSIAQAYQFVETANAEVGFVAYSQVIKNEGGSVWLVGTNYYEPIHQDAVLLETGRDSEAAEAFLEYLRSREAADLLVDYGYKVSGFE